MNGMLGRIWEAVKARNVVPVVEVDAEGVTRRLATRVEHVAWADLVEVGIVTTDEGPMVEDFWWLLRGRDGSGCAVAGEDAARCGLLDRLQRLPRFDNEAVVRACGSVVNASFTPWTGTAGEGAAAAVAVRAAG